VKFSLDKAIGGKFVAFFLVALLCGISDTSKQMKIIDDYTFDITLAAPPPPYFLPILGLPWVPIFDSVAAKAGITDKDPFAQDWLNTNIAGFGPYTLDQATPGQRCVLKAHTNYWGGTDSISRIVEQAVEDSSSRVQLLLTGQADYAEELTALQLDVLAKSSKTKVTSFASSRVSFLAVPNNVEPYNSAEFRKAMAMAVPYDDIIKTVYRGRAERWKTLIVPWFQGATDEFWKYDTNPAAAKAVLSKYGKPITLSYINGLGGSQEIAILVQKGFNDAGLETTLRGLDLATANTFKATGTLGLWIDTTDSPAVPSVLYNMQLYFTSTAFQNNLSNYKNPDMDKLAKSLATNPNPKQQAKIIRIVQQKLMNDLPLIPLAYTGTLAGQSKRLFGIQAHEIGLPYFQDASFLAAT
jgi:peptide/nickel transport system substrate-binding protein